MHVVAAMNPDHKILQMSKTIGYVNIILKIIVYHGSMTLKDILSNESVTQSSIHFQTTTAYINTYLA